MNHPDYAHACTTSPQLFYEGDDGRALALVRRGDVGTQERSLGKTNFMTIDTRSNLGVLY